MGLKWLPKKYDPFVDKRMYTEDFLFYLHITIVSLNVNPLHPVSPNFLHWTKKVNPKEHNIEKINDFSTKFVYVHSYIYQMKWNFTQIILVSP